MATVFVPYTNDRPASIEIKGHRLIILAALQDDLIPDLFEVGGTEVRPLQLRDETEGQLQDLNELAECIRGGIVIAPPGVRARTMIKNLENELPWLQ